MEYSKISGMAKNDGIDKDFDPENKPVKETNVGLLQVANCHALSLRQGPSIKSELVFNKEKRTGTILMCGTKVKVLGKVNEAWSKVETELGVGFVMSEFLVEV